MDGGFKALDELRKAGVIGAIGVGINEADTSLRFIQAGDFDCMLLAGRYTLLEQGGLEEFLPECVKRNVSVILGGPYNSGILTGGVKPGATHDYVAAPAHLIEKAQKIEAVCQRHGVELGAAAMQFPLFHPARLLGDPGRAQRHRSEAEHRAPVGKNPGRALERAQARKAARSRRANTELVACHGRVFRNRNRHIEEREHRPVRMQATGRARTQCLPRLWSQIKRCIERQHADVTQPASIITQVHFMSRTEVKFVNFVFARLLALHKGPCVAGRPGDHAIRCVAGPDCQQCFHSITLSRSSGRQRARRLYDAVITIARMRPSTAAVPKRCATAAAARLVASSRREASRASISLHSGVP